MTGTAAHLSPVIEVDRTPIGNGQIGPVTRKLMDLYYEIIRGNIARYSEWCTPVAVEAVTA